MKHDVRLLTKSNEKQFEEYMYNQLKDPNCLRKDWFCINSSHSLIYRYKNYLGWTLLYENNQIVAFAGMQHFKYLPNAVRVCTRLYYDSSIRHEFNHASKYKVITPVTPLLMFQFDYLKHKKYDVAVATLEPHRSKKIMQFMAKNLNDKTQGLTNFVPQEKRIQTFDGAKEEDYQWYMEHRFK